MTVEARLTCGGVCRTIPLTQYDEGQKIHLNGITLPASYLAEFANSESGTAEQIAQTTDTVTVPDKYLTSGSPVYVWIVVVGEDERTTRYEIIVPVRGRGEPDDYTPTPSEQTAIEAAIEALNEAVTAAGVAIEHYPKIEGGYWYVWDVTNGAWVSTEVPAQGPQGETGATGNGIASAVLNADYTLTLTFTNGTTYTTPSIRGAQGAQGQDGAPGADGYSPTASVSKSNGVATITITDKNGTTTAQVTDGQPGPGVPAGGTTNQMLVKKSDTDYDGEWANQPSVPVQDVQVDGTSVVDGQGVANIPLDSKADVIISSASGEIASFSDGADDMPLRECVVQIDPVQDLHGYDNPWPAGGGVNKFDILKAEDGAGYTFSGGTGTTSAGYGSGGRVVQYTDGISIPTGTTVTISADVLITQDETDTNRNVAIGLKSSAGNGSYSRNDVSVSAFGTWQRISSTVTAPGDANWVGIQPRTDGHTVSFKNVQVELGSSATDWTPYSNICPITGWTGATISHSGADTTDPDEISITFPSEAGTVYGGTLDVTTGLLTVDRAIVDMGTLDWTYDATNERFRGVLPATSSASVSNPDARTHCLCSIYKTSALAYSDSNRTFMVVCVNTDYAWLRDNRFTDASTFRSAMSGVQLVYELATPITYTLTPQEIRTLLGANNIWADTGDILSVTYPADTKSYIDDAIPSVPVRDVQVNGVSVLNNGVANVPIASNDTFGTIKVMQYSEGLYINSSNRLSVSRASDTQIKNGTDVPKPLTPYVQNAATFYGLAKAAGDSTQSASSNAVGTYTEAAKSSISQMLDAPETVSGSTPSITAKAGVRYVCGEVSTLSVTVPASGCVDVVFESGPTATVLTVTSTKSGVTAIKWASGWDGTCEANTVYEINILDGEYGVVGAWT